MNRVCHINVMYTVLEESRNASTSKKTQSGGVHFVMRSWEKKLQISCSLVDGRESGVQAMGSQGSRHLASNVWNVKYWERSQATQRNLSAIRHQQTSVAIATRWQQQQWSQYCCVNYWQIQTHTDTYTHTHTHTDRHTQTRCQSWCHTKSCKWPRGNPCRNFHPTCHQLIQNYETCQYWQRNCANICKEHNTL
jgi:hypothetical protein